MEAGYDDTQHDWYWDGKTETFRCSRKGCYGSRRPDHVAQCPGTLFAEKCSYAPKERPVLPKKWDPDSLLNWDDAAFRRDMVLRQNAIIDCVAHLMDKGER